MLPALPIPADVLPVPGAHNVSNALAAIAVARELGVDFFATAFDHASADFLAKLDMPAYKLASGDLKNVPLLKPRPVKKRA